MSSITTSPNYEGRLYGADDINAGGLVALDRRSDIQEYMLRRFPDVPVKQLQMIMQEQELLLTCSELTFVDLVKTSQEAAK